MNDVQASTVVNADAHLVWQMVSDVTRMGEWSPETTSCRWLDGASGPQVGARFRGTNQHGFRRWSTTCTVTAAQPGKQFAFDVHFGPVPISRWSYEFSNDDVGCAVTEGWRDLRPLWMRVGAVPAMGIVDRPAHNRRGIESTLAALKAAAESH